MELSYNSTVPCSSFTPTTLEPRHSVTGFSLPSFASLNNSLCRSTRCTAMKAAPYFSSASPKSKQDIGSRFMPSTDSQTCNFCARAFSNENPRLESTRVPLGETASAAPIWAAKDDFSKIYGFEIVIVIDLWLNTHLSMSGKGFSILRLTNAPSRNGQNGATTRRRRALRYQRLQ
jgi:hypothetical protein